MDPDIYIAYCSDIYHLLMIVTNPTLTAISCKPFLIIDPNIYICYYSQLSASHYE